MRSGDQKFRIENPRLATFKIFRPNGIHVMNHQPIMDLVSGNSKITGLVSEYHEVPNSQPLSGSIESLIDPSIESESSFPHFTRQFEVVVALFER